MRRILSLDGGGIKGIFSAAFLSSIEEELPEPIVRYFDLIVGTSTGGIIALALGLGLTAEQTLALYSDLGRRVFPKDGWWRDVLGLGLSKYDNGSLRRALDSTFGERRLGDATTRLVIPAVNLETGEVYMFKTSHHPRFHKDFKERAVDVALATAAAPTFFSTHRLRSGLPLIDGGLWANNPVAVAVAEAIGVLNWDKAELRVLSVGCTQSPLDAGRARWRGMGRLYWAPRISDFFLGSQSSGALGMAQVIIGHENVTRVCPVVANGRFQFDGVGESKSLAGLGYSEGRRMVDQLRDKFFTLQTEAFVPAHTVMTRLGSSATI